jgi:hypothetical protein
MKWLDKLKRERLVRSGRHAFERAARIVDAEAERHKQNGMVQAQVRCQFLARDIRQTAGRVDLSKGA